ncbi:MAG TPA: hypothetical protein VMT17_17565 [Anaeromyxobacteraceae bacterium]|nr:hypothetical protein [Anaeromyxobacteraceae bacterium]
MPAVEDLRVPKRRVPVEVVLPGGAVRQVFVYLSEAAAAHEGPERVSDLLNGADPFIPALESDGGISFLHRSSIAVARVPPDAEPDGGGGFTIPMEHDVEITLSDGSRLAGLVSYVLPPESARLGDFLNRCEPFFRLLERDAVALVGRAHVARVALVSR